MVSSELSAVVSSELFIFPDCFRLDIGQYPLQHSGHLLVAVALVVHEDAAVVAVLQRELQVREELLVELGALVRLMRLVLLVRSWCAWCAGQLAR